MRFICINILLSALIYFASCILQPAFSQVFPVQATTQLTPPYSLYLTDYVAPGSERLALNIFLGDIARPDLQVKLKLRIVGQNITIETKPEYNPPSISIQGGVPLRLISSDLADYFNPDNLNFTGSITRRQFDQQGKLPEGVYQICFEVLEYNRSIKISNTACGNAWMILNDPPLINLPRRDEKLKPQNPQNVVLQWTSRHTGSPNSAFSTEYEVKLVEVWPATRNINDAILTSPPIFEETTQSTTLIYGPSETPLELGRKYAFRVRAKSIVGVDELDLFKNQGYSETYSFIYGDACTLPTGVLSETTSTRLNLKWDGQFNHTAFKVQYRQAGTTEWYTNNSTFNEADITSLKPSTFYEYQVSGVCGFFDGAYTQVASIKTKDAPAIDYSCGKPMETFNLDPSQLTGSIKIGDIIKTGDFDVQVAKISGGGGTFSGEGVVVMPMMNKVKVKTEFSGITVANESSGEFRMVNGFMNVTGAGVEVVPQGVKDLLDKLEETLDIVDSALTIAEDFIPPPGPAPESFVADTLIHIDGNVLAVIKDPATGKVTITTTSGKVVELPPGGSYAVTDNTGKGYLVDSKGNHTKTTADNAVKASKREYNLAMKFVKDETATKYGLDEKKIDALAKNYEVLDNDYFVSWKAVDTKSTDAITAKLAPGITDLSKVRFTKEGLPFQAPPPANREWKFTALQGASEGSVESIVAYFTPADTSQKEQVLGKLNMVGYEKITKSLVIVPVNDIKYPYTPGGLTTGLNKIYRQAVAEWEVTIDNSNLQVALGAQFDDGESGMLANYTEDMRKVISAFKSKMVAGKYYLFMVNKPKSGNTLGFMPRSKTAGFIFVDKHGSEQQVINTIAHELGHGAFTLEHIFSDYPALTKGSTQNLMDYNNSSGAELLKYQWDKIHDPVTVINLFEDDAEGKSRKISNGIAKDWRNADGSVNFMTPDGKIVRLPAATSQAYFTFGIGEYTSKDHEMLPAGLLKEFETQAIAGKDTIVTRYIATWLVTRFAGYYAQQGSKNAASFYLPKGESESNQGAGTAILLIYNSSGSQVVRYSGLPNEYMLANPKDGNVYLDLTDKNAYIKASGETPLSIQTYANRQIAFDVSATSPRPEYAGMFDLLTKSDRLKCQLILTKIYEYRIVYPDIFDRMTVDFGNWSQGAILTKTIVNDLFNTPDPMKIILQLPKAKITAGYFEYYLRTNSIYLESNAESKQSMLITFLTEFRKMIDVQKLLNAETIKTILDASACNTKANIYALDPVDIRNAVEAMSTTDLKRICSAARAYLVGRIIDAPVVSNSLENAIYKLMWTCPSDYKVTALFLQELANTTNNNNEHILGAMVEAIDDETMFIGQNFNTMVMNFIIRAYSDYLKFAETAAPGEITNVQNVADIKFLKTITPLTVAYLENQKLEEFKKKIVTYNYVGFTKRLFKQALVGLCSSCSLFISDDVKSVVNYKSATGTLEFTNKAVQGFVTTHSDPTPLTFDALQPIMLDDKSKLIDIYANESEDGGVYVPAITLYFVEEKGNAKTTAEAIGTAVDLVSLAIPGANTTLALKLLNYADKLSSVASLVGTASSGDYPQFAQYLQITSGVLGGLNMIGSSSISKLTSLEDMKSMKDAATAIKAIDHTQNLLSAEKHAEEVAKLCDRLTSIKSTDVALLDLLNKGKNERELLIKTLELEKSAASAAENTNMVGKLDKAIERLRVYSNGTSGFMALAKTSKIQTLFARFVDEFKNVSGKFTVTSDGKYITKGNVQLAHLNKGELVIDKFDDLNDLSAGAKLEESLDNVTFYKAGNGTEQVDDILIFDDAGTIKCLSGTNCFVAGTQVCTNSGNKPIENIRVDDVVFTYDEHTGNKTWEKVIQVFSKTTKKLNRLVVGEDTLWATPEHKFLVKAAGWIQAAAITVATLLQTQDGYATVRENVSIDTVATVYNFTVENTHTYYVGGGSVLTHNDCQILADFLKSLSEDESLKFLQDFAGRTDKLVWDIAKNPDMFNSWKRLGNSPLRTNKKYIEAVADFPSTWKIETSGGITKVLNGHGDELAELTEDMVKAKGGSRGSWNDLLNKPPIKNHKYQVDRYLFETDEFGRVNKVKGELEDIERGRNEYQQGMSVQLKDGVKGRDDGGHLIANILNGPGEQINYLPQTINLNRGRWKSMEENWAKAMKDGKKVEIEIIPMFNDASKRPYKFIIRENVGGKQNVLDFPNY